MLHMVEVSFTVETVESGPASTNFSLVTLRICSTATCHIALACINDDLVLSY